MNMAANFQLRTFKFNATLHVLVGPTVQSVQLRLL